MTSILDNRPLRTAVAAVALAWCGWGAQAAPFVAQGQGCGVPAEGSVIGEDTTIKLPGVDMLCPGVVTTKRQEFLDGLLSYTTEEFPSDKIQGSKGYTILGGNGTIDTDMGGGLRYFADKDATVNGRWDTTSQNQSPGGGKSGGWFVNGDSTSFIEVVLDFADPQDAVGFYLTDYGDFGAAAELELFSGTDSLGKQQITGDSSVDGTVAFFGVYSAQAFDRFRINFNQPTACIPDDEGCDNVGLDSLIVGVQEPTTGVPEPGSLALIGLGLVAARRFGGRMYR